MNDEPENKPPGKNFKGMAFVFASIGLLLLVGAVDSIRLHETHLFSWLLGVIGLTLLALGVMWGTRKP